MIYFAADLITWSQWMPPDMWELSCAWVADVSHARLTLDRYTCQGTLQMSHRTRPLSSHTVHRRAWNSSVKWFRCIDFLLPLHEWHGRKANPPHLSHDVVATTFCKKSTKTILEIIFTNHYTNLLSITQARDKTNKETNKMQINK